MAGHSTGLIFERQGAWRAWQRVRMCFHAFGLIAMSTLFMLLVEKRNLVETTETGKLLVVAVGLLLSLSSSLWYAWHVSKMIRDIFASCCRAEMVVRSRLAFPHRNIMQNAYQVLLEDRWFAVPLDLYESLREGDRVEITFKPHLPTLLTLSVTVRGDRWPRAGERR